MNESTGGYNGQYYDHELQHEKNGFIRNIKRLYLSHFFSQYNARTERKTKIKVISQTCNSFFTDVLRIQELQVI